MKFPKVHTVAFGLKSETEKEIAATIFKNARTRIESGFEAWTCLAIGDVSRPGSIQYHGDYGQTPDTERVGLILVEEIERRLGHNAFVTGWLQEAMGDAYGDKSYTSREYRMAWIDSMIEELQ